MCGLHENKVDVFWCSHWSRWMAFNFDLQEEICGKRFFFYYSLSLVAYLEVKFH